VVHGELTGEDYQLARLAATATPSLTGLNLPRPTSPLRALRVDPLRASAFTGSYRDVSTTRLTAQGALQRAWFKLRDEASRGPVTADVPKLAEFLSYWFEEIVRPNLSPKTYERYEFFARLHIGPYLGGKRLDKITVRDIRHWLNQLASVCQCCAQHKDAKRPEAKRRCCAIGQCCDEVLSPRSRKDARDTLRAALACAIEG
jgi:hypothetical protein